MNPAQHPSPVVSFLPIIAIFGIFYFLVIRPQQRQAKEHEKMLSALKKGDRVLLSGGIYGTVTALRGTDLELKISDNVKVTASRSSVARLAGAAAEAAVEAEPVRS
jgi:preprotein translocase subunit YajC